MSEPIWRRVLRLHGPNPKADVEAEFAFHLEERTEALMARGMSEADARAMALRQFGDLVRATADCSTLGDRRVRRARRQERFRSVLQDVGYALRTMRRAPGFTLTVIATIALGIGANTVVFSLLNTLLFQPLDANRPEELVRVYTSEGHAPRNETDRFGASSYADYLDFGRARTFRGLAGSVPYGVSIRSDDVVSRFEGRIVSENYFAVLGRPPMLGGWAAGDEGTVSPGVIISHRFWQDILGGDPLIIGRQLEVNGRRFPVVGVTAPGFKGIELSTVDVYFPFHLAPVLTGRAGMLIDRGERSVRLIGRLAQGGSPQSAEEELGTIMHRLGAEYPASSAGRVVSVREAGSLVPMELMGRALIPTAGLVFGATLVMLAISGVNIAAVLLARTIRRRRELAVRLSLGAGPWRLVRQLITESTVLALAAGAVVIGLLSLLPRLAESLGVPPAIQPGIDPTVLGYAVMVALGFGLVFGLVPAFVGMRSDVIESLRAGGPNARTRRARVHTILVGSQIALSMLLLLVSGGLLGSLERQQRVDPGFDVERLIVAIFEDPSGQVDRERERVFTRLAMERLSAIPGIFSISVASVAPLAGEGVRSSIHIPGYAEQIDESMEIQAVTAGPDFFRTLGIPMIRGRELSWTERDTLPRVVINRSMAQRYWGGRDPIGSFVRLAGPDGPPAEVIGMADDARFRSLSEPPQPMYVVQRADRGGGFVLIRTSGDATAVLLAVRGSLSRNDVPLTLVQLQTMEGILQNSLAVTRAVTATLLTMGILAILLAAVGLYGVVSYVMTGRTGEFGIRLALGASPGSITRLVLGYGLRLALVGGVAGMILGFGALRLVQSMLFGSGSPLAMALGFGLMLAAVTLAASTVPALRAMTISPADALRAE